MPKISALQGVMIKEDGVAMGSEPINKESSKILSVRPAVAHKDINVQIHGQPSKLCQERIATFQLRQYLDPSL